MKYNLSYKYYTLSTLNKDIVIELSYDNTMNKGIFSAKTNTMFMDQDGDLGHACGIGDNEKSALEMCLSEIKELSNNLNSSTNNIDVSSINISMLKEINFPLKISIEFKSEIATCYFKKTKNKLLILTDKGRFELPVIDDVISTIDKNLKLIKGSQLLNFTKEYLQENDFYPVFDSLTI